MIGRTHGVHAEPITFGLKLANWYSETCRNIERFERAAEDMRVGKFSGAVGTFAHLEPELEEKICKRLGLNAAAISSQVIQRDRHASYLVHSGGDRLDTGQDRHSRYAICNAPKFARPRNISAKSRKARRRCRTSAIPITCEQISGLARVVRAQRAGRSGKRRTVARARHFALLGRARHSAGFDHPRGLPARTRPRN